MPFGRGLKNTLHRLFEDIPIFLLRLSQGLLRLDEFGDVLGDTKGADDGSGFIPVRHLAGQDPPDLTILPGFLFDLVDDGFPGLNNVLLILECRTSMLFLEKIKIGFPHGKGRVFEAEAVGEFTAASDETGSRVLEVDMIWYGFQQGAEQLTLRGQTLFGMNLFGDIPENTLNA